MKPQTDFSALLPTEGLESTVQRWLDDDMPSFDVGGMVVGTDTRTATLWLKSPGVVAGKAFVDVIFRKLNCEVSWNEEIHEGMYLDASTTSKVRIATVSGPVHKLLQGERTALNTLSRCSGVATESKKAVDIAKQHGWHGWVAGTRKTTPGFRIVEKYGLLVGGAATHRLDLSQMVMLKDNHIFAQNNQIKEAVRCAKCATGFSQKIEVECSSLEQALEAAEAGADIVMLDNYPTTDALKMDAMKLKEQYPNVLVEASGNITALNMIDYFSEYVDIISQGKLTQGYSCLDYSLKVSN